MKICDSSFLHGGRQVALLHLDNNQTYQTFNYERNSQIIVVVDKLQRRKADGSDKSYFEIKDQTLPSFIENLTGTQETDLLMGYQVSMSE
jgi:hypothetical protein